MTVAVVGAGIAGVSAARVLVASGIDVEVFDRGHRVGGRMAVRTLPVGLNNQRPVDVGAAYFTVTSTDFGDVVENWRERGLARPWTSTLGVVDGAERRTTSGPMRYAAVGGLRSLVEDLAKALPDNTIRHASDVEAVTAGPALVIEGEARRYDAVVVAMPDPQALRLLHGSPGWSAVLTRDWEPVLTLISVYDTRSWQPFDACFVNNDPDLVLVADDGARRGDDAPVLVAHSTAQLARQHLAKASDALVPMTNALLRVLPSVGPATHAEVKRWTYARPVEARPEPFYLDLDQRIGVAGDGWHGVSKVESAWSSGRDLARAVVSLLER